MKPIKTKNDLVKELKKLERLLAEENRKYEQEIKEKNILQNRLDNLTKNYKKLEGECSDLEHVISKEEAERTRYRVSMHHVACNLAKNRTDIPVHVILECLDADLIFVSMLIKKLWTQKN